MVVPQKYLLVIFILLFSKTSSETTISKSSEFRLDFTVKSATVVKESGYILFI